MKRLTSKSMGKNDECFQFYISTVEISVFTYASSGLVSKNSFSLN